VFCCHHLFRFLCGEGGDCVCVWECERDCVRARERERQRNHSTVAACAAAFAEGWATVRVKQCVCESVCAKERECVCAKERESVCVCVCARVCVYAVAATGAAAFSEGCVTVCVCVIV